MEINSIQRYIKTTWCLIVPIFSAVASYPLECCLLCLLHVSLHLVGSAFEQICSIQHNALITVIVRNHADSSTIDLSMYSILSQKANYKNIKAN